jgi:hypothetical protein
MRKGEDLNLQDERVWRARRLKASNALKAALTDLAPHEVPWGKIVRRNFTLPSKPGTNAGVARLGFTLLNNKESDNARNPTLAYRYPNSDHHPAMAFWRASLIAAFGPHPNTLESYKD